MKFINSKLHRWFYKKINKDVTIIKMKGLLLAIIEIKGQRYTVYGLPKKEFVEWSGRYYSYPYFHGYVIEYFIKLKLTIKSKWEN